MNQKKSGDLRKKAEEKLRQLNSRPLHELSASDSLNLIHELQVYQIELEMQNEELRRTQEEVEKSRSKYADLYDFSPVGYLTLDEKGLVLQANLTCAGQLGIERNTLIKKPFFIFIHKDDRNIYHLHHQRLLKTGSRESIDVRLKRPDGTGFHARIECVPIPDSEGKVIHIRTALSDITEYKRIEWLLMLAENEWERTFDTIPDIIVVTDEQYRVKKVNRALTDRLGVKREDVIGRFCYNIIHETDEPPSYCPHVGTMNKGEGKVAEIFEDCLKECYILSSSPVHDARGCITGVVEVFYEISARKKMEEQLRAAALTDELTGLLNRRGFFALSEQQCKLADRTKRGLALLYLDLNNMKKINDEFGHEEGDRALMDTAEILKNTFRESDIIARIGGDEFSVLLTEPPEAGIENIVINNVQDNLNAFNEKSGRNYKLSFSMGFAHFDPDRHCSVGDLISLADASMYEEKKRHINKEILSALHGKKPEKRKHMRYKTGDTYRAEIGLAGKVDVKDISRGGVCLTNIQEFITSKFHKFSLSFGNKKVPAKGIVVWTRLTDSEDYEAGLKFIGLTHNDKRSLEKMITGLKEQ